jgi:hypothetical protein
MRLLCIDEKSRLWQALRHRCRLVLCVRSVQAIGRGNRLLGSPRASKFLARRPVSSAPSRASNCVSMISPRHVGCDAVAVHSDPAHRAVSRNARRCGRRRHICGTLRPPRPSTRPRAPGKRQTIRLFCDLASFKNSSPAPRGPCTAYCQRSSTARPRHGTQTALTAAFSRYDARSGPPRRSV